MIDPKLFTVESLLAAMFDDVHGNVDAWRKRAEIVPNYMPRFPGPTTRPMCVVRCGESFLRHASPITGQFLWDLYGDNFGTPEAALLALLRAPAPPSLVRPTS